MQDSMLQFARLDGLILEAFLEVIYLLPLFKPLCSIIYIYLFFLASWRFTSRPPKIIAPTALLQQQQQQQASLKRVTVRLVYYSNTHLAKFMREIFSQESDTG
jgi:hypothetical protein